MQITWEQIGAITEQCFLGLLTAVSNSVYGREHICRRP